MEKISIFNISSEDEYLKNKDFVDVNETNEYGSNALITDDLEKIKWLIKQGININNQPAFPAVFEHEDNPEIQKYLIENGADINTGDNYGLITFVKDINIIKLLIDKDIDINRKDYEGNNYLYGANMEKTEVLIKAGIDIHNVNNNGDTILFNITNETVDLFLNKVNINHCNNYGRNAAFYSNDNNALKKLIEAGLDMNKPDNDGRYCFFFCSYPDILKTMLYHCDDINKKDNDGNNVLFYYGEHTDKELVDILLINGVDTKIYSDKQLEEHFDDVIRDKILLHRKIQEEKEKIKEVIVPDLLINTKMKKRI